MRTSLLTPVFLVLLSAAAVVVAQPGSGSNVAGSNAGSGSAGSDAGSAGPAGPAGSGSGADSAGSGSNAGTDPGTPTPDDSTAPAGARKACAAAMNADPSFASAIIHQAELQLQDTLNRTQVTKDVCTVDEHEDAQKEIATNKRQVILAYIAMWLVAAGFVFFMWRKQQGLKQEIENLRRDLDAATKDTK